MPRNPLIKLSRNRIEFALATTNALSGVFQRIALKFQYDYLVICTSRWARVLLHFSESQIRIVHDNHLGFIIQVMVKDAQTMVTSIIQFFSLPNVGSASPEPIINTADRTRSVVQCCVVLNGVCHSCFSGPRKSSQYKQMPHWSHRAMLILKIIENIAHNWPKDIHVVDRMFH